MESVKGNACLETWSFRTDKSRLEVPLVWSVGMGDDGACCMFILPTSAINLSRNVAVAQLRILNLTYHTIICMIVQ